MTSSSATLSLFGKPSTSPRQPVSIVLSIVMHAAVAGAMYYGLTHLPRIELRAALLRYPVRQIDLRGLDPDFPEMPNLHEIATGKIPYPSQEVARQVTGDPPRELAQQMRSFLSAAPGRQLLIQPDIHSQLSFADQVPVPTMMIWGLEPGEHKTIVPPSRDLPVASNPKPTATPAITTTRPSEIPAVARDMSSVHAVSLPVTRAPVSDGVNRSGAAASLRESMQQATSAAVLSISEFLVPDKTLLRLPTHEIAPSAGGIGRNTNLSLRTESAGAGEADDITVDGRHLSADHLLLPKDGKFNVVVVGSSLEEQYPEAARIWADRIPYTAYMHVGLNKSWILQYSATREAELAGAGRVERMNAPWPYDILRPNLYARDLHANALIVHGVLNQAGRLESLAIAAPSGFRYASFVLRMLREWQFRPALQNGQATPVEVLLIIPEVMN